MLSASSLKDYLQLIYIYKHEHIVFKKANEINKVVKKDAVDTFFMRNFTFLKNCHIFSFLRG